MAATRRAVLGRRTRCGRTTPGWVQAGPSSVGAPTTAIGSHTGAMAYEASPDELAVVERAQQIADEVLFPLAQDVDRSIASVDGGLRALAGAGLFGITGPATCGGSDLAAHAARRAIAAVGSGCGATFFVWVQHHGVVRSVRASTNAALIEQLLGPMCAGNLIAGVAFAHVRRAGPPAIRATPLDNGGWQLDGLAPWATSWGIADQFCIAAESDDGELVWSMIPGSPSRGVTATELELSVFSSTGTVALHFEQCVVGPDKVVLVEDADRWRAGDRRRAAIGQPAVLGVTDRAIRLLDDIATAGAADAVGVVADAAGRLRAELVATWVRDDLIDTLLQGADDVDTASDHRAACLDLARRATTALLAATGGRGMNLDQPAQRLAREADFYVIQAQTTDGRAATLRSV